MAQIHGVRAPSASLTTLIHMYTATMATVTVTAMGLHMGMAGPAEEDGEVVGVVVGLEGGVGEQARHTTNRKRWA